ncbi:uncharacterized protein LOC143464672 isoform X1 [Clavelina lepadiformis]|uniref:uncharacterized protein LOC143464672 isoform X1 n=1 Tax=Clavelina lepadiformis TaxID=159417 RepID=UPI0040411BAA
MEEGDQDQSGSSQANNNLTNSTVLSEKSWEHSWSVAEIRKHAGEWSLAADIGLLKHMKEFATKLTTHAREVSRDVSQLLHDTQLTDAKIQTVTDFFLTLSDSQFIENRVYDEDDSVSKETKEGKTDESKKPKTREEREAELLPRLKEAVQFGVKVIDDAYDVLDIKALDSDSEEDDEDDPLPADDVILEAKDPYVTRPLPYLIGSRNFIDEDDVGVGDLLSSDDLESEAGSVSESEDEIEKPATVSDVSSSDYDSDLSGGSDEEEMTPPPKKKAVTLTSDEDSTSSDEDMFADADAMKSQSDDQDVVKTHERPSKKKNKPKKSQQSNDMFAQDEQEDDLFAPSEGLFGSGGGLFDQPKGDLFEGVENLDDENSLENTSSEEEEKHIEKAPVQKSKPKFAPHGGVSVFGGAIKKGFFNKNENGDESEEEGRTPPDAQNPVKPQTADMFDESDSDDGDLFVSVAKATKKETSTPKQPAVQSSDLFDESENEDDLFDESSSAAAIKEPEDTPPKSKRPTGGVSMFGSGGSALQTALAKASNRRPSTSSAEAKANNSATRQSGTINLSKNTNVLSSNRKSLFSTDSDDNQLFGPTPSKSKTKKPSEKKEKLINKRGLFMNSESSDEDLFNSANKSKSSPLTSKNQRTASIKNVNSKNSNQFEKTRKISNDFFPDAADNDLPTKKQSQPKAAVKNSSKANLFSTIGSDNDENDLFASSIKSSSKSKPTSSSLKLTDSYDDDDDGLFGDKPPPLKSNVSSSSSLTSSKSQTSKSQTPKSSRTQRGLFDESDEDEPIIKPPTSSRKSKEPVQTKSTKPPSNKKGLFDDSESDDDLFSGMKSATSVKPSSAKKPKKKNDLFNDKDPEITSKPEIASSKRNKPKPMKDLFDSDSEEEGDGDLFSASKAKPSAKLEALPTDNDTEAGDVVEKEEEAVIPKKKLAGAVSMFGAAGGELLAAISKQRSHSQLSSASSKGGKLSESSSTIEENKSKVTPAGEASKSPIDALFGDEPSKNFTSADATNVTAKPFSMASATKTTPVTKVSAPTAKSSIGKLQSNLAINPSALLPGAAPKIVSTVDVDAPLESATKTRSRGQAGRRPPSRQARKKIAQNAADDIFAPPPTSVEPIREKTKLFDSSDNKKADEVKEKDKTTSDDLLDGLLSNSKSKSMATANKPKTALPDIFGDDSADDFLQLPKTSKSTTNEIFGDDDDLFKRDSNTSKKLAPTEDPFAVDFDMKSESKSSSVKNAKKKSKKLDLFANDDLFADLDDLPVKSEKTKKNAPVLFEDEDIFGDLDLSSKNKTKNKPKDSTTKSNALAVDNTDDIFGDLTMPTTASTKKSKPKNKAVPKKDLFEDDIDLFGDLPVSKPQSKKATKKSTDAPAKSIFDNDDIFSSIPTTSKTTSAKKTKTKPSQDKTQKDNEDLFDDPLNALLGP